MAALLKDDCEDGNVVHAIDKAAKHLSYDSIKELQPTRSQTSTEHPLCFGSKFLHIFRVSVIFNPHAIQITVFIPDEVEAESAILHKCASADLFLI